MKKMILIVVLGVTPFLVQAANPLDIVINEVAWMGQVGFPRREWIELYNNKNKQIDISGWKLKNAGAGRKTLEILKGKILPKGFFLICENKMTGCDFVIKNLSLANDYQKNGALVLEDKAGNIISQTPEAKSKKWPAGSAKTRRTMERKNSETKGDFSGNWQESRMTGGTPKAKNVFNPPRVKNQARKISSTIQNHGRGETASPDTLLIALSLSVSSGTAAFLIKRRNKKGDL